MGEGRERIPRKTLNFFGEARCAVPCLLCCCTLARLPCRCRTLPSTIDKYIDAGTDQSVIRATLLRYTLKSLPVNILLCGKVSPKVEDSAAQLFLNAARDKGFSDVSDRPFALRGQSFHRASVAFAGILPRVQPARPSLIRPVRYPTSTRFSANSSAFPGPG